MIKNVAKKFIVGVDEVGRGSLAGSITVVAVAAPLKVRGLTRFGLRKSILAGIRDSKKLSEKQREIWNKKIRDSKIFFVAVASMSARAIDTYGISRSARTAVGRALGTLKNRHNIRNDAIVLLDGSLYAPRSWKYQKTIVRGDETIPLIASASVVAKVHRDRMMKRLSQKFLKYGFGAHKGYGTRAHIHAIRAHGVSSYHRRSFCTSFL